MGKLASVVALAWLASPALGCTRSAPDADSDTSQAGGSATDGGNPGASGDATSGSAGNAGTSTSGSGGNAGSASTGGSSNANCPSSTPTPAPTLTTCTPPAGASPANAALAAVNDLRAHMGIACMSAVPAINTSAQKHCDYYQQNQASKPCIANAHAEVASCAGFVAESFATRMTAAGYMGSPRSEVMAFSGNAASAVAQWINSVYHRTPLLSPWIRDLGYGTTADCDTIDMGQGTKTPDDVSAQYPYPGQVDLPLSFDGSHEGPMPAVPPGGWPSASPVHLYAKNLVVSSHDIFSSDGCVPLAHQWLADKEQYVLYAHEPFAPGTEYRVVINGTRAGEVLSFDWTFTTKL